MQVIIGAPIKNRAWILPEYLKAINKIKYHNKQYLFYENHSLDNSLKILQEYNFSAKCNLYTAEAAENVGSERYEYGKNNYAHLANIRNKFLKLFLETEGDYLFSVDSDVIVKPNVLDQLLIFADQKTIVGAAICNIPNQQLDGRLPGNFMINHESGNMIHPSGYSLTGLYNCDVIGACYLIPRQVVEDGIIYAPDWQGEDIPFCRQAKAKGYRLLVNLDCKQEHRMIRSP